MDRGERTCLQTILACLYLRGLTDSQGVGADFGGADFYRMAPRGRWPRVMECLRSNRLSLGQASTILGRFGLWEEASCLDDPGRIDAGLSLVLSGRVLTAADLNYPRQWIDKLGGSAPPVMWKEGDFPTLDWMGIVGSRAVADTVRRETRGMAQETLRLGRGVVTGGAEGCDEAAIEGALALGDDGARRTVVLLPRGIDAGTPAERAKVRKWVQSGVCVLSMGGPDAEFSTGLAMERNALIYAMSDQTVAMAAELKSGGTWAGAVDALRRRLCVLGVPLRGSAVADFDDSADFGDLVDFAEMPGLSALRRLGAISVSLAGPSNRLRGGISGMTGSLTTPAVGVSAWSEPAGKPVSLDEFVQLKMESGQPSLFGSGVVDRVYESQMGYGSYAALA